MDVFHGLHVAVNRQARKGGPDGGWLPEQKLSLEQALAAYTTGAPTRRSWRTRRAR